MKHSPALIATATLALLSGPVFAQALPRITALYPPGAKSGATLDVAIRGGGITSPSQVIVSGPGISATLNTAEVKIDPAEQKLFQAKCTQCHEMRGPANISRTADQWVATVDRMIREKSAPIETAEREKIVSYVRAAARASAGLTARITVAADATPGMREIRVVGQNGTSTAFPFEITAQPDALEAEPNNEVAKAPVVAMPTTINGQLPSSGDVDCYAFNAKKGERVVFNVSGVRLNEANQAFFFPVLYLYDEKGKELAKNTGYFSLDPLIDWTAPADGKYVIAVRDMLYRGNPATIYRLSMGSLPYKTYLFPAGGKRGATVSAALNGQNMEPTTVPVALPADAPAGIRQVSTPHGTFRFAVGEYDEYVEKAGEPQNITLPLSINGRVEAAKETDRYTFTISKEQLGPYTFEAFSERLGSPTVARLTLLNDRNRALVTNSGGGGTRDPRIDYTFAQPGTYTLEIADANDRFGPEYVYRISAGSAAPEFTLTMFPDNPNLGPGSSVYLGVTVQRRVGINTPIEVVFPNLPAGITASRAVIQPNETRGFVILTAAPDAKPGTVGLLAPVARTAIDGKTVERPVVPYEIYRINNNAQIAYRSNMVVTVGPEAEWDVALEPGAMQMSADGGPVTVKVRLNRKTGSARNMPFAIIGIPQGVNAPQSILMKPGESEITFTMTPTNTGVFAPRPAGQPPVMTEFTLALVNGREGEGMMMASPAIRVTLVPAK